MRAPTVSNKQWIERARRLQRDRAARERAGACVVEGIRQVVSAIEGGCPIDAVLVDPARLRSDVAWAAVADAQARGAAYVELKPTEFERVSTRDHPVGLAVIVRWAPRSIEELKVSPDGLYLVADDVRDPGNLGTLLRTLDAAGGAALITHAGTDTAHPTALRAALGTTFLLPTHVAPSLDAAFNWAARSGVTTLATSAHATPLLWELRPRFPLAVFVGNEGEGLAAETIARCDMQVGIPMFGSATSLNVSVAAGVILFEARRWAWTAQGIYP